MKEKGRHGPCCCFFFELTFRLLFSNSLAHIEVRNSDNITFYAIKGEAHHPVMWIEDANVTVYGYGKGQGGGGRYTVLV